MNKNTIQLFLSASVLTTAVVTPIEVTISKNNTNTTNNIETTSNIINKHISNSNGNNIDSILSKIPENKVENIINKYYSNNEFKNNAMFIKNSSNYNKNKIIIQKTKQILNEIYTHKLSYSTLIQKVKDKYNNLTKEQKEYINNKIYDVKNKFGNVNIELGH